MYTVKDVSEITGVSIRTLRYYDEIGLLKPVQLTESGYRLYDNKSIEKLQEIMFFRELEIPLMDIKLIMDNPDYDKRQALLTQKSILEHKRNHINGLIELINDVTEGVNTMNFETFNEKDIQELINHTLRCMSKEALENQIQKHGNGNLEKYREYLAAGFKNKKAVADIIKWYGSKEKAMEAILASTGNNTALSAEKDENKVIYQQLVQAKESNNLVLEKEAVAKLADLYKAMFHLDNARAILLDLAKEYLQGEKLAKAVNAQYGDGVAEYIALAIKRFYGE
ncbi:MAG: HTH merR-type domain-containing protein [Lachnoclostridium sp.]|jgi:DNA-binding transcriptional MerR regulator